LGCWQRAFCLGPPSSQYFLTASRRSTLTLGSFCSKGAYQNSNLSIPSVSANRKLNDTLCIQSVGFLPLCGIIQCPQLYIFLRLNTEPAILIHPAPDSRYRGCLRISLLTCWLNFSQVGLSLYAITHWVTSTNFIGFLPIPRFRIYLGTRTLTPASIYALKYRPFGVRLHAIVNLISIFC